MGGRGCRLSKLFPVGGRTLCFFAGLKREVARSKTNSDLLEEAVGRRASGKDPHKVIGDLLHAAIHVKEDRFRLEFNRIRIKQYPQLSRVNEVVDSLRVALFNAAEALAPVDRKSVV